MLTKTEAGLATGMDAEDEDTISTMRWLAGFCICVAAVGIFAMVAALFERADVEPIHGGDPTSGRIVKVDDDGCTIDGCSYTATIVFRADGRSYTTQTGLDFQDPKPATGSTVQLSYDPADPARVHDLTLQRDDWIAWEVTGATLLVLGVTGALLSARSVRRQEAEQKAVRWAASY